MTSPIPVSGPGRVVFDGGLDTTGIPKRPVEVTNMRDPVNGWLQCSDRWHATDKWCAHIEETVKKHLDAQFLMWQDDIDYSGRSIYVPMVPTHDLWSGCLLREPTPGGYRLILIAGVQGIEEFIGFVGPGEGRLVMREMILDWFRPRAELGELGDLECKAGGHSYAAQMHWEDSLTRPNDELIQKWCVFSSGLCIACKKKEGDMDDLVPADEGGRRFPR